MQEFKKVKDTTNREVVVDYGDRKLMDYSNADEIITYNAEIVENGNPTGFYTDFKEAGIIEDVEERLEKWNNAIKLAYATVVDFNASKNDSNREIWNGIVELIKRNPGFCFDENGDFREELSINPKEAIEVLAKSIKYDKMTSNLPNSKLSAEERSEAARKAVKARWDRKKKGDKK